MDAWSININQCILGKLTNKLITEASDIRLPIGEYPKTIKMQNDKTNIIIDFNLNEILRNSENDIDGWIYKSKDNQELTVFND